MRRVQARRALFALALAAIPSSGCGDAATVDLPLGWRFADGRSCADASVATVRASVDGMAAGTFVCAQGDQGRFVTLSISTGASAIALDATTASGTVIYRGDARPMAPLPSPTTVTLYFTGGN